MENIIDKIKNLTEDLEGLKKISHADKYEFDKTESIILALLERAKNQAEGNIPKGRWSWVDESYTTPEKMLEQAKGYIDRLKEGTYPFENLFAEVGGTVIDHAIIEKDGIHHLFYIRGKACTTWPEYPTNNFGHAVSSDLIHWKVEAPVLQSVEGEWDEYQVWAPHVIYHDGRYWMFYTGVNNNAAQAIGLATSKDLYHWERFEGNPIIKPGSWGIWDENRWSDCRDPVVLKDGDIFYAYYCTNCVENGKTSYCVGIASSHDLYIWKDEGYAIMEKSTQTPPESPFAVKKDGKYYLFYTDYKAGTVYAISDDPVSGWKDAPDDKRVVIPGVCASEVYDSAGKWYISYTRHYENHLQFFGIMELVWNDDGSVSAQPVWEHLA